MRHLLALAVIAFSVSALLGGFMSGRAAVRFPAAPLPSPQSTLSAQMLREAQAADEVAHDQFARDSAVTLASTDAQIGDEAEIALVIVDAGRSPALESPFLALNVPVTLVIDPSGGAASAMFALAQRRGDAVYLQTDGALRAHALDALRKRFPGLAGIAARLNGGLPPGALAALRAANLAFFDERSVRPDAAAKFAAAGVRYAARGVTIDDHAQRSYVTYMLAQAVHLARGRTAVVMARPFPGTLQAFEDLLARASRDGVRVVALP
ncbi:MAG TPA: divergent polysaccharide deacetylase family protein [Candidatus Baltobacteraceae bacterium]|nr:divergent polysaccharide deacetylase family protein [Candidatus Baltobacteraceae bacterium]